MEVRRGNGLHQTTLWSRFRQQERGLTTEQRSQPLCLVPPATAAFAALQRWNFACNVPLGNVSNDSKRPDQNESPTTKKRWSALTPCGWEHRRQIHRHLTANLCRHRTHLGAPRKQAGSRKVRWQVPPKNSSHKCLECLKTLPRGYNQVAKSPEVITRGIARHHDAATSSTTILGVNKCKHMARFSGLEKHR